MSARTVTEDDQILAALAAAMVQQPRASLQELAKAIGISKATLYRFCRTREELEQRLFTHAMAALDQAIKTAGLEALPPIEALKQLNTNFLQHSELTSFLTYFWKPEDNCDVNGCLAVLDAFFLRGQQAGAFRIDVPAPALSEIWSGLITSLVDAERRGRIAKSGLKDLMERTFLRGVAAP